MLALTAPIKARLQALPELAGWALRTGSEHSERRSLPAVDLRCSGATVAPSRNDASTAAIVQPQWQVTIAVRRSDTAADQLDAAFAAVFAVLHGWMPGLCRGRGWEPLQLRQVTEPMFGDDGIAGLELIFTTSARYVACTPETPL